MGLEPQAAFAQLADQLGTDWAAGVMLSPQVSPDSQYSTGHGPCAACGGR